MNQSNKSKYLTFMVPIVDRKIAQRFFSKWDFRTPLNVKRVGIQMVAEAQLDSWLKENVEVNNK